MTRLYDEPSMFMEDMLAGFLDLHAERVIGVPGGVIRSVATPPGKVAVVVGGGSGHYPAFYGIVGSGLADGAVVGNVFTSPSAEDVVTVATAANSDAGVVLITGNYAGDVINFTLAVDLLAERGIEARYIVVTDDIASADIDDIQRRRGIAGGLAVFKAAAAASDEGRSLEETAAAARHANGMTRSLGVAFDGCTLPGADEPLFSVPVGLMGVGVGIHGEPGIFEQPMPRASDLAALLVEHLLKDRPVGSGTRVAAILNGLGRTKYEELFLVWRSVSERLRDFGLTVVEPEVGELVTSLDMSGCSLTLHWLDDDLERWWRASTDTPAYKKRPRGDLETGRRRTPSSMPPRVPDEASVADAPLEAQGRWPSTDGVRAFRAVSARMVELEPELARLDAVAGDGDHGRGMVRGTAAALSAAATSASHGHGLPLVVATAGKAWADKAGGTSGALWGAALVAAGDRLGASAQVTDLDVAAAVRAGYERIAALGKAQLGDKTMLDALGPFVDALESMVEGGLDLACAWKRACVVSADAARETTHLTPRIGRARPLAERSVGTPDPGAVSTAEALSALTVAFNREHRASGSG